MNKQVKKWEETPLEFVKSTEVAFLLHYSSAFTPGGHKNPCETVF